MTELLAEQSPSIYHPWRRLRQGFLHPNPIIFWITLERLHSQMRRLRQQKSAKTKSSTPLPADSGKDSFETISNTQCKKRRKRLNLSHRLSSIKTEHKTPIDINSDESKEDCS